VREVREVNWASDGKDVVKGASEVREVNGASGAKEASGAREAKEASAAREANGVRGVSGDHPL
jgi:hypothetical protein